MTPLCDCCMAGKIPPLDGRCMICGGIVDDEVPPTPFPDADVEELHAGRPE